MTGEQPFANVPSPTPGIDPRVALATALQAAPGVFAVLVGSGMSSAAGIPTGWQVVQDLIRKVARAEGVSDNDLGEAPEDWWAGRTGTEAHYDTLLAALAPTDAARQTLLRGYFNPPAPQDPIEPTEAHKALAWLCATGRVRVVLTTNFDRLLERALEAAGAGPQVVASATAVDGMTPLVHAGSTLVKLHGDWATLGMRNTPEELKEYSPSITRLLDRVLDEYGLLVVGWSAEYDVALAEAIRACPSRRYPTYWATFRGHVSETARQLITQRTAAIIETAGADEFLTDLAQRVDRLDQRAARQARASPLRSHHFPPDQSTAPDGWAVLPLLQLRAAAALTASIDDCGMIGPEERDEVVRVLRTAAVTHRLRALSSAEPLLAEAVADTKPPTQSEPLTDWEATPSGHQSIDYATYRLGGDAKQGVSALVTIRLPGVGAWGGTVAFIIDVAISLAHFVRLGEAAMLWRDSLVLTSGVLPEAIGSVLPPDAEVSLGELHLLAASTDGHQTNRPNLLSERVDLSPLGAPTRTLAPAMGFAVRIPGPLTEHDAAEAVAQGLEQMALSHGYLDPRVGLAGLRLELGL